MQNFIFKKIWLLLGAGALVRQDNEKTYQKAE